MQTFFKSSIALILILALAFFLRIVNISNNPPALYGDELTLTYDAYSILKTGHDQTGAFLPLTFTLSEGRPPGYVYFTLPFIAIFGPTALGVRLLSVLSGVGIVLVVYLLTKHFFRQKTALLAALLMAISPWDLSLSRGGFETHFALFLSLLGIVSFVKAKEKPWLFLLSAFSFGLAMNTYHSYKLVIPLILPVLVWFGGYRMDFVKKYLRVALISLGVFLIFFFTWFVRMAAGSDTRFNNTNIFNQQDIEQPIIQKIDSERTLSGLPAVFKGAFYNKIDEYAFVLGGNYLDNLSTSFLFLHGDGNPRHNQALMGEFYLIQSVLILLAVIFLFQTNRRLLVFLLLWVFIAPAATALVSKAHALRSSFLLPPLTVLSAYGAAKLWSLWRENTAYKILTVGLALGLSIQFLFLLNRVYFLYPYQFGSFWSLPAKQATVLAMKKQPFYDRIILSDRIDDIQFAYPTYTALDPRLVIGQYGKSIKQFGNVYIEMVPPQDVEKFIQGVKGKVLYIGPADSEGIYGRIDVVEKSI